MKQQSPVLRYFSVFLSGLLLLASCKKVNEATELGGSLIPPVDNVNTFDTLLEVISYNHLFNNGDSARSLNTETHFLGNISQDPLFGKSASTLFLQLKPTTYIAPFEFSNSNKIIALDSAVLVLGYQFAYGDTMAPLSFQVFEIDQSSDFRYDSAYFIAQNGFTYSNPISAIQTVIPNTLNDSLYMYQEAAANQLRLRLDHNFGMRLLNYDSTNAYRSDSAFKTYFKGFAIQPQNRSMGNAMIGISPSDTNTKVALYYRYTNESGNPDTAVTYFRFNSANSAVANYIERDRTSTEVASVAGDDVADELLYIQNAPGTYARLLVPGLKDLTNRIVHRAELVVSQVPDPYSNTFTPPSYLYLDAYDTADGVYRSIPVDVAVATSGQVSNTIQFGMEGFRTTTPDGLPAREWRFDISRYVQRIANGTLKPYEFRLSSPFLLTANLGATGTSQIMLINPTPAVGRVRLGGGNHAAQPARLRIIYSKL